MWLEEQWKLLNHIIARKKFLIAWSCSASDLRTWIVSLRNICYMEIAFIYIYICIHILTYVHYITVDFFTKIYTLSFFYLRTELLITYANMIYTYEYKRKHFCMFVAWQSAYNCSEISKYAQYWILFLNCLLSAINSLDVYDSLKFF